MNTASNARLKHVRYGWGDHYTGTKEQLQALGIAPGIAFPGETDGPKRKLTTVDRYGRTTVVTAAYSWEGDILFRAACRFVERGPRERRMDVAPGVELFKCWWTNSYYGSADALVAAGIVRLDQLPGQPGRGKVCVTYYADGRQLGKGERRGERGIRIEVVGKNKGLRKQS